MPKIKYIVKIEKKETPKDDSFDAADHDVPIEVEAYNNGYNQCKEIYDNKLIGLDEGKIAEKLFSHYHPETDIKKLVKLEGTSSKYNAYLLNVWEQCVEQARALKQAENELIVEEK